MKLLLGIESSCDDTSAAVVSEEGRVLSNVLANQDEIHAPYGGVVPELASRQHLTALPVVVERALSEAGATLEDITGVAVTNGPGLLGSLLVGLSYAKALAWALSIEITAVNHVEAHFRSAWIERPELSYPALGLVVSGGHSHLYSCDTCEETLLVAGTRDDAAGEALDKLAKRLHLPYPGGPVIDRLAERGDSSAVPFSLPKMSGGSLDYSFSGIKTAALFYMRKNGLEPERDISLEELPQWEYDLIASYRKRVVDHLIQRLKKAALLLKPASMVMGGGVARNSLLRKRFLELGEYLEIPAFFPSNTLCSDNAAMIAFKALTLKPAPDFGASLDAFPVARWRRLAF